MHRYTLHHNHIMLRYFLNRQFSIRRYRTGARYITRCSSPVGGHPLWRVNLDIYEAHEAEFA